VSKSQKVLILRYSSLPREREALNGEFNTKISWFARGFRAFSVQTRTSPPSAAGGHINKEKEGFDLRPRPGRGGPKSGVLDESIVGPAFVDGSAAEDRQPTPGQNRKCEFRPILLSEGRRLFLEFLLHI